MARSRVRPSTWSFVRIDQTCLGRSGRLRPGQPALVPWHSAVGHGGRVHLILHGQRIGNLASSLSRCPSDTHRKVQSGDSAAASPLTDLENVPKVGSSLFGTVDASLLKRYLLVRIDPRAYISWQQQFCSRVIRCPAPGNEAVAGSVSSSGH